MSGSENIHKKKISPIVIKFANTPLDEVTSAKYLGVTIINKLIWKDHVTTPGIVATFRKVNKIFGTQTNQKPTTVICHNHKFILTLELS